MFWACYKALWVFSLSLAGSLYFVLLGQQLWEDYKVKRVRLAEKTGSRLK